MAGQLLVGLAEVPAVLLQPRRQAGLDAIVRMRRRHGVHEAGGHRLQPVEHVVGPDGGSLARRFRRHAGMPVPVGAHPRSPAQEGPDRRGPRARAPRVGGRPAGSAPGIRPVLGDDPGGAVERVIERPVEPRRDHEQGLVEEEQGIADLVERRGPLHAQRRGPPQQRDLLAEAAPDVGVLVRGDALVIEVVDEAEDAAQGHEHRATPGLGRMRRQHEADGEVGDELLVAGRVVLAQEPPHGLLDGAFLAARAGGARTLADAPHAVLLLGQVRQVEVEAEGLDEVLELLVGERVDDATQLALAARAARGPDADGQLAHALDEVQEVLAGLLGDDLAEEGAEQLDLPRQRVGGAGGADAAGLGAHGRVRRLATVGRSAASGGSVGHHAEPTAHRLRRAGACSALVTAGPVGDPGARGVQARCWLALPGVPG